MVQQMNGRYKVKAKNLIPLFIEAKNLAKQFARFRISHVGRGDNQVADGLANEAMDQGSAGNA
jgi:ribonuclease HI